ncbi:Oidioi.mRNA.OKI2018_I69.chr2.g5078.t1.cds [Oikopleura dioica]|uniref:Copper transport protein n=1 Tax=Oikopleura dioica TaxID=34765 RepID=A0ABN7T5Z0_OIKDI|nr:Oidioi.mRNA.OKI2018_I69.chr2.g5078.t1.cds [Oikopleura dioica]
MDHGGHGDHGMIMYFHEGGMIHGFLFKDWMLHNSNDHMKAGFALFFLAFFYEGLKVLEHNIATGKREKRREGIIARIFGPGHIGASLLHFVNVWISYTLMLAVMYFNTWLIFATCLGFALGYFAFGWSKDRAVEPVDDPCCN